MQVKPWSAQKRLHPSQQGPSLSRPLRAGLVRQQGNREQLPGAKKQPKPPRAAAGCRGARGRRGAGRRGSAATRRRPSPPARRGRPSGRQNRTRHGRCRPTGGDAVRCTAAACGGGQAAGRGGAGRRGGGWEGVLPRRPGLAGSLTAAGVPRRPRQRACGLLPQSLRAGGGGEPRRDCSSRAGNAPAEPPTNGGAAAAPLKPAQAARLTGRLFRWGRQGPSRPLCGCAAFCAPAGLASS